MLAHRVIALTLLVLLIGGISLLLHNLNQPWWLPPLLTMVSAVWVISGLQFGDRDAIVQRAFTAVDGYLFLSKRRAYCTHSALVIALALIIWLIAITWPPPTKFLSVSVYREKRASEGFVVGAKVILLAEASGATKESTVTETGIARFSDFLVPTPIDLQINETRAGIEWTWAPERFVLHSLPAVKDYDLAKVPEEKWTRVGQKETLSGLGKVVSRETHERGNYVGDSTLQAVNAPWGVPRAPLSINRYAYILGFAPELRVPLWVAYAVSQTNDTVDTRLRRFERDPAIQASMQSTIEDYSRSEFDRGHLVSPQDVMYKGRVATLEASYQTTLTPQVPQLNRRAWLRLERATRQLSRRLGKEVYVIDGPLFEYENAPPTIGPNRIPVPSHFFRVVTWVEKGSFKWASYLMANSDDTSQDIAISIVSIGEIEERAKLTLLPLLDQARAPMVKQVARGIDLTMK